MSEETTPPAWTSPGDTGRDAADAPRPREDTVAFATEHTERIQRSEPPPPPPPPAATGTSVPPPPPGPAPTYGAGDWRPPPRPGRRAGLVVAVVAGVVVLLAALAVGVVFLADVVTSPTTDGPVASAGPDDPDTPAGDAAPDAPAGDLTGQAEAVLGIINSSEERMIAFQQATAQAIGEDGTVGDASAQVAQEAQDTGDDLTRLRSELRALADGDGEGLDGLRDVRDTYATHMDAWIAYVDAVAGSPSLAAPDSPDAQPLWREIERSADDFVEAIETRLPDELPSGLQDLARFIVERGFGGAGDAPPGEVV